MIEKTGVVWLSGYRGCWSDGDFAANGGYSAPFVPVHEIFFVIDLRVGYDKMFRER